MEKKGREYPTKIQETPVRKVIATIFWDQKGVLLVGYCSKKTTVTSHAYFDTLIRLKNATKSKHPGKLSTKIVLIHDNITLHKAALVTSLILDFGWETYPHLPHSPDITSSDFHLFPGMNKRLGGQRFANEAELCTTIDETITNFDANLYSCGIENFIARYNETLNKYGDHAEK